jgi:hypothetical protein
VKGKRYKVASSYVIFLFFFQKKITLNPFKINTFSLIHYTLTLSVPFPSKKQTPQQMKISPASATGFWNKLYFYGANFILMESTLFELYIVKVKKTWDKEISILYPLFYINNCNLKVHYAK